MNILCEHPQILINPKFAWNARKFGSICLNGTIVRLFRHQYITYETIRKYYPRKVGVTVETLDNYFFINESTGETSPLYFAVPCGRCTLCRVKKTKEYACRAIAETNKYNKVPFFCTFTYNDDNLPADGVNKRDCQLFLKRLRSKLDSDNIPHEIRYIMVGEYGSKTLRPHYHAILWNFPTDHFRNITEVKAYIEEAWSRYKFEYRQTDSKFHRIPLRDSDDNICRSPSGAIIYERAPIGHIKVLPVKDGCVGYVTKYMRKPSKAKAGQNKEFMLSSRRGGGIGSSWIRSQRELFMSNPQLTSLPIVDRVVSGKTFKCPITPYVKDLLLPSPSKLIKQKKYKAIKRFFICLDIFQSVSERMRQSDILNLDCYDYANEVMLHYYDPSLDPMKFKSWQETVAKFAYFRPLIYKRVENTFSFLKTREQVMDYYAYCIDQVNESIQALLDIPDYRSYFCERDRYLKLRQETLEALYRDAESIDVQFAAESIRTRDKNSEHKEIF